MFRVGLRAGGRIGNGRTKQKGRVMVTTIAFQCKCGKKFHIYIPKARMIKQLPGMKEADIEKARESDKEDLASAEMGGTTKFGRWLNAKLGIAFIDGSIMEAYQCECGATIDLDNFIKKQISNNMPPDSEGGDEAGTIGASPIQQPMPLIFRHIREHGTWVPRTQCDICGKKLEPEGKADCLDKNEEVIKGREAVYALCCNKVYTFVENNDGVESFAYPEGVFRLRHR